MRDPLMKRAKRKDCTAEEENLHLIAENKRLKAEVESLRKRIESATTRPSEIPIAVKKALNMAGYWNVHPNDVLLLTPRLAEEFERETKICPVQHDGVSVFFPPPERDRVVSMVARLMPELLPKYRRSV
jgi:hypothetical protein